MHPSCGRRLLPAALAEGAWGEGLDMRQVRVAAPPLTSGSYMSGGSAAAVKALATAAEMFDLTGGNSEEGEAALDEEGNEAGLEIEEGPV